MVHSYINGDTNKSRDIQLEILKLCNTLFIDVSPIPVKAAMNLMGMNVGNCRLPLVNMSESNIEILKMYLKIIN